MALTEDATPIALDFELSPTQYEYVESSARHVWLEGPAGEGKTFASVVAYYRHHQRMLEAYVALVHPDATHFGRPMKVAVVRDTHINLKNNFLPSVQRGFPGQFSFRDNCRKLLESGCTLDELNAWYDRPLGAPPTWIDATLFGMDDLQSLDRIQGGEYDLIHVQEPAPILSSGNNGIREEVFLVCASRIRGGDLPKRLQLDMNPADEDHWSSKQMDDPLPDTKIFRIPPGENRHLTEVDRLAVKEAFKGRADLYARFVKGERAKVYAGVAITPEFNERSHMATDWLLPNPNFEIIRAWDFGLNPTCVIFQPMPSGRIHFLDCLMAPGFGVDQLIESKLIPLLNRPRYAKCKRWRDLGDPAGNTREQSNSEHTAARVINEKLKTTFEDGVSDWETRKNALKYIFEGSPGGLARVQVNPRITEGEPFNRVKSAFAGGYSYKVDGLGRVTRDGPDKASIHSHVGDAISHTLGRLYLRPQEPRRDPRQREKRTQAAQRRATGYGVGAGL